MKLNIRLFSIGNGLCLLGCLLFSVTATPLYGAEKLAPWDLYPKGLTFDVKRNGDRVGRHTVAFKRIGKAKFQVNSMMTVSVTLLSIPVYRYRYISETAWQDGQMTRLMAEQDDDGDVSRVRAVRQGQTWTITGPKARVQSENPLYPTDHWHFGVIKQTEVLDTLTGKITDVTITPGEVDRIRAQGRSVNATPYRYTGDINTTVWYDHAGRWVKMAFEAGEGSNMEYYCIECGLAAND